MNFPYQMYIPPAALKTSQINFTNYGNPDVTGWFKFGDNNNTLPITDPSGAATGWSFLLGDFFAGGAGFGDNNASPIIFGNAFFPDQVLNTYGIWLSFGTNLTNGYSGLNNGKTYNIKIASYPVPGDGNADDQTFTVGGSAQTTTGTGLKVNTWTNVSPSSGAIAVLMSGVKAVFFCGIIIQEN